MKNVVVRKIRRALPATIQLLGELGVATVHEAQGRTGLMKPGMRPIYPAARVAGSAVTVSCHPGDNIMIHAAMEVVKAGDVLVVTTTGESTDGMFGDLLGTSCQKHGVRGLIIDAGIRDVSELTEMGFPVWAKAISAQGTVKATGGSVNIDVVCAGAIVHAGDVIIGDQDGVVVVPRAQAERVAELGDERQAKEEKSRARLKAGELGLDMYGLRAKLAELGVVYEEGEE